MTSCLPSSINSLLLTATSGPSLGDTKRQESKGLLFLSAYKLPYPPSAHSVFSDKVEGIREETFLSKIISMIGPVRVVVLLADLLFRDSKQRVIPIVIVGADKTYATQKNKSKR
jgi:hypothetical protein